jgi:hypothetical protein
MKMIARIIFGMFGLGVLWLLIWNAWGCILIGLSLMGLAFCLKRIPAEPPHLGLTTIWGERKPKIKKEGWRFLAPFFPFLYNVILVNVEKKNQDLPAETVRTPDLAVLEIPISLTWTPGTPEKKDKRNGEFLINYLNSGGEEGVKDILADIVRERVREWAIAVREGPQTFKEAISAQEDAVEILIKAVAGEELEKIPSSVPTTILFKYFDTPQGMPTESEKKMWLKNWKKVDEILKSESRTEVEEKVEERRKIIKEIRKGNGVQPIPQLGITLNRLNIGDITIKKGTQLEVAAEKEVKEKREREAEIVELDHVGERIGKLMGPPWDYTRQEARDIVQTERGKVEKKINEIVGIDLEGLGRGLSHISKK